MGIQAGTRLGPYEILAALGAGGMGEVYRARDSRLGRDVAIKTLPASLAADPERLGRFRREAETLAALNHPHIAMIFGLEQIGDAFALILELVEGPTLADRIARAPLAIDEALPLARELALALEAAHEKSIVHRDLKPANIKLTSDGSLKLLDFGLAKALDPSASGGAVSMSPTMSVMATQAGMLLGTAAYMSPEQVRGGGVDKRADIWAFGVVVYEMLTGRGLFGGDTVSDTLAGVLREPIDLQRLPPGVPRAIRHIVGRCLERDPKRRLRDIGEARIAIEEYLANPSGEALLPPVPVESRPLWRDAIPWAVTATLIVTFGVAWLRRSAPPSEAGRDVASFALDLAGLAPQRGSSTGGLAAISRDGRRIVLAARGDPGQRGQQRLYQRTLDRPELTAIPGTEESSNPFISPDGGWVGFESRGQLKKVSFSGGVPMPICDVAPAIGGAAWLDDDTIVVARNGLLYQVPAGGGGLQAVLKPGSPDDRYVWPAPVPGRRAVLYTVRAVTGLRGRFRVAVLDLETQQQHVVADAGTFPRYVNGFVVYAEQATDDPATPFHGRILAVPFDTTRLTATGPPVTLLEDALVFSGGAGNYDLSANGTLVFFSRGLVSGTRELAWLTATGAPSGGGLVEGMRGTTGGATIARLSRDDRIVLVQIGFAGTGGLYVYSVDRGSISRIPFDGDISSPIFGPGEGMATFASGALRGIWAAPIDGSKPAQRLTAPAAEQHVPGSWTRDGRTLVFTQFTAGSGDIMMLRRGDRDPTPLVVSASDERTPVLSPDNRWLAYASNESGRYEIYVRAFPGPGGRYAVSTDGGDIPAWSKDGRRLLYVRDGTNLMMVDVAEKPEFSASPPRLLVTSPFLVPRTIGSRAAAARPFDIAADGRLLIVRAEDTDIQGSTVRVILNLDQDIRRRLAPARP